MSMHGERKVVTENWIHDSLCLGCQPMMRWMNICKWLLGLAECCQKAHSVSMCTGRVMTGRCNRVHVQNMCYLIKEYIIS